MCWIIYWNMAKSSRSPVHLIYESVLNNQPTPKQASRFMSWLLVKLNLRTLCLNKSVIKPYRDPADTKYSKSYLVKLNWMRRNFEKRRLNVPKHENGVFCISIRTDKAFYLEYKPLWISNIIQPLQFLSFHSQPICWMVLNQIQFA